MKKVQDLRVRKTYLSLHQSLINLMDEISYEDVSVGALCDGAMIRRATFYKHFGDKYAYFNFFVSEYREEFQEACQADLTLSLREYCVTLLEQLLPHMESNAHLLTLLDKNALLPTFQAMLTSLIRDSLIAKYQNDTNSIPHPDHLSIAFLSGGMAQMLVACHHQGIYKDPEKLLEQITGILPSLQLS